MTWLQTSNKIEKAYIIRINTPESIEYANQCAASCVKHNVPYTFFEGYMKPDLEFIRNETDFEINLSPGERGCTASHVKIWKDIVNKGITAAIFEHDVIVKRNFLNIEVPDNSYLMMGYRVDNENDYECSNEPFSLAKIYKFEGTHAYAINPITAKACLNKIFNDFNRRINQSIDGFISINNMLGYQQLILDPTPVVCVVGSRISTAQDNNNPARYNESVIPSFYDSLTDKSKYRMVRNSTRMEF